ncbi:MAG: hypothetical protein LBV23_01420 [Deltaproteobacteria bacterium]|jgi:hypothetical protein|nr:hypothetical protein [Deltaproteobacteria bacterium]
MSQFSAVSEEEFETAKEVLRNCSCPRRYRAALAAIFAADGRYAPEELLERFGFTPQSLLIDPLKLKRPVLKAKGAWGGARHFLLTFAQEEALLSQYESLALLGNLSSMSEAFENYKAKVGKEVCKSTFYRMLKRHGWRKVKLSADSQDKAQRGYLWAKEREGTY